VEEDVSGYNVGEHFSRVRWRTWHSGRGGRWGWRKETAWNVKEERYRLVPYGNISLEEGV